MGNSFVRFILVILVVVAISIVRTIYNPYNPLFIGCFGIPTFPAVFFIIVPTILSFVLYSYGKKLDSLWYWVAVSFSLYYVGFNLFLYVLYWLIGIWLLFRLIVYFYSTDYSSLTKYYNLIFMVGLSILLWYKVHDIVFIALLFSLLFLLRLFLQTLYPSLPFYKKVLYYVVTVVTFVYPNIVTFCSFLFLLLFWLYGDRIRIPDFFVWVHLLLVLLTIFLCFKSIGSCLFSNIHQMTSFATLHSIKVHNVHWYFIKGYFYKLPI